MGPTCVSGTQNEGGDGDPQRETGACFQETCACQVSGACHLCSLLARAAFLTALRGEGRGLPSSGKAGLKAAHRLPESIER